MIPAPQDLREWLGRREVSYDQVTSSPLARLSATLDRDDPLPCPGDVVPPLWTWLYFLPSHLQSELGPDGHELRGNFLPPVTLPRRMWAGGRLKFLHDLHVGSEITRRSEIAGISQKSGHSGPLVFVVVRHEISDNDGIAVVEEHDIVYRDHVREGQTVAPQMAPDQSSWIREIRADEILLFRYSALTFNGHRIHFDRRYATEAEHYPGLVVHGPLIATLLLDLLRRNLGDIRVNEFTFRAIRALFDVEPFFVCGRPESGKTVKLWAKDMHGHLAMEATAVLAPKEP